MSNFGVHMNQLTPSESQITPTDDGFIINPNFSFGLMDFLDLFTNSLITLIETIFWHKITITSNEDKR